jgi:hypothetical protein
MNKLNAANLNKFVPVLDEAELVESVKLPKQVKPAAIKLNVDPVVNPEFTAILTLKQIETLLGYKIQLIA